MKKIIKCECCGHEREVEACDTCCGSGVLMTYEQHNDPYRSRLNTQICKDCQGTGLKGGQWLIQNALAEAGGDKT